MLSVLIPTAAAVLGAAPRSWSCLAEIVSQLAGPQGKAVPQHQRHHNGSAPFIEAPHHIEPGLEIIVSNVRCVNSLRPNRSQAGGWSELRTRRRSHAAAARHRGGRVRTAI